jgi:hypothetical protein
MLQGQVVLLELEVQLGLLVLALSFLAQLALLDQPAHFLKAQPAQLVQLVSLEQQDLLALVKLDLLDPLV